MPHLLMGGLFTYGQTKETLDGAGSHAMLDVYAPGSYASYAGGNWYANGLLSFGINSVKSVRQIAWTPQT